jgi:DNA-directed RNA polymerase subunit M/transcription elongation factor TFIIS
MFEPERSANETVPAEYGATEHTTEIANGRKVSRKVALAATVTCPTCSFANKPEWLNKSRTGDSYATTLFCEQCGSLLAVWAMQVDAQVVAQKPG